MQWCTCTFLPFGRSGLKSRVSVPRAPHKENQRGWGADVPQSEFSSGISLLLTACAT